MTGPRHLENDPPSPPRLPVDERLGERIAQAIFDALAEERAAVASVLAELKRQRDRERERADKAEALLAQAEDYARDLQDGTAEPVHVPRVGIVTWDHKERPDPEHLALILSDLTDGLLHVYDPDTGCDQYALMFATRPINKEQANATFMRWWRDEQAGDVIDLEPNRAAT